MGAALRVLPGTQLRVQVVQRQAQQPRHVGLHAHELLAVALGASGQAARGVALQDQLPAFCQTLGGDGVVGRGGRVRQLQLGKVQRHFAQIGVGQGVDQTGHQVVVAATLCEIAQLVVQVTGGFARQARVVAVGPGAALLTVAGGAGAGALGHVVGKWRRAGGLRVGQASPKCGNGP